MTSTRERLHLCDEDCNNCSLLSHPNSRMLTRVFNELLEKFGNDVYLIVQNLCPNLTVCYDCRVDDFCHWEGCELVADLEEPK
jgi:hypothetical protein